MNLQDAIYESKLSSEVAALHAHYSTIMASKAADYHTAISANTNLVRVYTDHVKAHMKNRVAKVRYTG